MPTSDDVSRQPLKIKVKVNKITNRRGLSTHHNHSNSDSTVPTNPFIKRRVHTIELGGNSNFSHSIKSQNASTGRSKIDIIIPTNPKTMAMNLVMLILY